jgi:hypothetical protein
MKTGRRILATVALAAALFTGTAFAASPDYGAKGALAAASLDVPAMLRYAIEDEYLAHAEYQAIIAKLGAYRPFTNIIRAEETHIADLKDLFAAYKLAIPQDTAAALVPAVKDFKGALEAGVQAELENIAMYERLLGQKLPDDVRQVFEWLKSASQNHLAAFRNSLSRY